VLVAEKLTASGATPEVGEAVAETVGDGGDDEDVTVSVAVLVISPRLAVIVTFAVA
jgi:hypothetical protein